VVNGFRSAISLHSHTHHSKEDLEFLPRYLNYHNIPFVSSLAKRKFAEYKERTGKAIDFSRAYWTPPLPPGHVLASEIDQIENKLNLAAFVSITDHDSIAGPLELQTSDLETVPISVEWTIPFEENTFHLGVHHLPLGRAVDIMAQLARYTAVPSSQQRCDLLAMLSALPETLIILNHPCCNFVKVSAVRHWQTLRDFLELCRPWIHAIEINGMRPWRENLRVPALSEQYHLPIVAGGDRHGCRPNTMVNLTEAQTWGEYAQGIRNKQLNHALVLPAYEEPVRLRELATAGDVLRRYPHHPYGQRRFTDRVFADVEGYSWHPLSFYLDGGKGTPPWLPPVVAGVVALSSDEVRPLLRVIFSMKGEYDRIEDENKPEFASLATTLMMEDTQS
jgi:hypothetical protein